ncbi:hypothetical protein [Niallia endozanthoxylica]|uniref:Uncharacterized protein n=1 Tax=Niallia endozanthoxylica TaxID=2036016 RepID=A0A5J5I678_9BACI|nr:hypothetical protein [Niallia endozanthoxylica]KAA9031217.1 hypothetical protein F4V44_01950 [Niallia endozanthoxylica]
MVTFSFLAVFILLGSLIACVDIILFNFTIEEVLLNLFHYQLIQDRMILFLTCLSGFIWAVIVDIRIKRKKGQPKQPLS